MSKTLTLDDFPEGILREIAEQISPAVAVEIWEKFGGTQMYIPLGSERKNVLYVLDHYNGHNAKALARALRISERTVYAYLAGRVVKSGKSQNRAAGESSADSGK